MSFSATEKLRQNNAYFKIYQMEQADSAPRIQPLKNTETTPDTARAAPDFGGELVPSGFAAQVPYAEYLEGCVKMISSFASPEFLGENPKCAPRGAACADIPAAPNERLRILPAPNT